MNSPPDKIYKGLVSYEDTDSDSENEIPCSQYTEVDKARLINRWKKGIERNRAERLPSPPLDDYPSENQYLPKTTSIPSDKHMEVYGEFSGHRKEREIVLAPIVERPSTSTGHFVKNPDIIPICQVNKRVRVNSISEESMDEMIHDAYAEEQELLRSLERESGEVDPMIDVSFDLNDIFFNGTSTTESAHESSSSSDSGDSEIARITANLSQTIERVQCEADSSQMFPGYTTPLYQVRRIRSLNRPEHPDPGSQISSSSMFDHPSQVPTIAETDVSENEAEPVGNVDVSAPALVSEDVLIEENISFREDSLGPDSDREEVEMDENEIWPSQGQGALDRRRKRGAPPLIPPSPKPAKKPRKYEELPADIDSFLDLR